jgi:hypothetical protein
MHSAAIARLNNPIQSPWDIFHRTSGALKFLQAPVFASAYVMDRERYGLARRTDPITT